MTKKEREAAIEKGLRSVPLRPQDESRFRRPSKSLASAGRSVFTQEGAQEVLPTDSEKQVLTEDLHTVVSKSFPHTVGSDSLRTPLLLPTYSQKEVLPTYGIPLSPLQWGIWQVLVEADRNEALITYHQIAERVGSTKGGVRDAVYVLQKEGGIREKTIFRKANPQGMRVRINSDMAFYQVSTKEAQGILKRGMQEALPTHGQWEALPDQQVRMYVCKKNTYIREEDLANFLRTLPTTWQIREQTLVQIADLFPLMTTLEYRLSLRRLVEQAQTGKPTIQNPNAWLKAAFEKNGGPLVTEREIEARMQEEKTVQKPPRAAEKIEDEDGAVLRRYLAASPEERTEIDRFAEEQARPLLAITGTDKHAGILEEARLEAVKQYFAKGSGDVKRSLILEDKVWSGRADRTP